MPFNLPPPWDAGFALPDNVLDEGLERRAFVTKQMPRGTYDDPRVGNGGYVVPEYIDDEGYGQGTYTTKWMPRNTYVGPRIPHDLNPRASLVADRRAPGGGRALTFSPHAAPASARETKLPAQFERYGHRAATIIMSHVNQLPQQQRKPHLQKLMKMIDPSLYKRAADIATRYHRQGMPASQALHHGIARAMSTGIAAEIIQTGRSRTLPAARSLLGLGCYGPQLGSLHGLGATDASGAIVARSVVTVDGSIPTKTVAVNLGTAPVIQVGSGPQRINLSIKSGEKARYNANALNIYQRDWLEDHILNSSRAILTTTNVQFHAPTDGRRTTFAAKGIPWPEPAKLLGGSAVSWKVVSGGRPIFYFDHPKTGLRQGVRIDFPSGVPDGTFDIWWQAESTLFEDIWAGIKKVAAVIVDLAMDVVHGLSEAACELLGAPGIGTASKVVGGPAGAVGAGIAKSACAAPPPPPPPASNLLPIMIMGGAALAAVLIMSNKRKAPTP